MKIKKLQVHFIIQNIFVENESKKPYGSLTFIFYQKYFYDKMDLKLFYFHMTIYCYINFCCIQFLKSFRCLQGKCAGWVIYTKTNHIMHDIYGLIVVIYCSQQYMWEFFSQLYRENSEFYLSPYENSSKMRLCFLALVPNYIFFFINNPFLTLAPKIV